MKPARYIAVILLIYCVTLNPCFSQSERLKLRIFKVHHRDAQLLYEVVRDLVSAEGRVSLDSHTNSLIVLDFPENLVHVEGVITSLDVREKNVEIKTLIVETTNDFLRDMGLQAGQVVIPAGRFQAVLAALRQDRKSTIRSEMTIKTLSGYPASLAVSRDEIFGQSITHYMNPHNDVMVVSDLRQPMGSFLEAVPTVNNDGTITVIVQPTVSRMENGAPYQNTVLTQVVVNNGDTVVLGGLDTNTAQTSHTKTLFGIPMSREMRTEAKKVMVFLTATTAE